MKVDVLIIAYFQQIGRENKFPSQFISAKATFKNTNKTQIIKTVSFMAKI